MRPLDGLSQLHLVSKQDYVLCYGCHRGQFGNGHLAGFIDKQVVQRTFRGFVEEGESRSGNQARQRVGLV
ncbi:MAG: hypothetical protein P4L56_15595 [Candidatus Sulfopaludibacter sp.]|nr:hypothetical protein [Candidatus Sulfopaludibacter sp.]